MLNGFITTKRSEKMTALRGHLLMACVGVLAISVGAAHADVITTLNTVGPGAEHQPGGMVTYDVVIDTDYASWQWTGSEVVVAIQNGTIHQDGLGGDTPPNPAWLKGAKPG